MKTTSSLLFFLALTVTGYSAADPLSTQPVPRTQQFPWMSLSSWYRKHADDIQVAEAGSARLLFLGDSITEGWATAPSVWKREFAPYGAANFGIGGDLTQNLLWRLDHGAVEKLDPEVVVILIGVNNFLHNDASARDTFAGVQAVVDRALEGYPKARIVLHGIFPYGELPDTAERARVRATNALIEALAENPRVDYFDFGSVFLQDDGRIGKAIMADYLHPTERGYKLWAKQLRPVLSGLLEK